MKTLDHPISLANVHWEIIELFSHHHGEIDPGP